MIRYSTTASNGNYSWVVNSIPEFHVGDLVKIRSSNPRVNGRTGKVKAIFGPHTVIRFNDGSEWTLSNTLLSIARFDWKKL